nr:cyclic lactone autoinducer peptide [Alkalibaculum sporogenes]
MSAVAFATMILTLVATTTSASACWFGLYQPKEPKMLRK